MNNQELKKEIILAKKASNDLLDINSSKREQVLFSLASNILKNKNKILQANKKDILETKDKLYSNFLERMILDSKKIDSISRSVIDIAKAKDILGEIEEEIVRPSGILIKKIRCQIGLIAIIYESRPNVTIDAFSLAFKSGNSLILKGGKEIVNTNKIFLKIIKEVLTKNGINENIVKDFSGLKREKSQEILINQNINCLIPRGGKKLIDFVVQNAKIPVIKTGASVVHLYIDDLADINIATKVVLNSKLRRVSICNALDVLIINRKVFDKFIKNIIPELKKKEVKIKADKISYKKLESKNYPLLAKLKGDDFDTEFLDYVLAIKIVENLEEAINHISLHSLGHSEGIITKSEARADKFFKKVDSACLFWNTSTQFSDGGEFGMGGEIGISTQKLHARGPFSFRELTTYKYLIVSKGEIRN